MTPDARYAEFVHVFVPLGAWLVLGCAVYLGASALRTWLTRKVADWKARKTKRRHRRVRWRMHR